MGRVAMSENQAIEPTDAPRPQILIQDALVVPRRSGIKQPVATGRAEMDRCAGTQIEHVDLQNGSARPIRMFDIQMAAGDLRKKMDRTENEFRQGPIGVVKNQ